MEDFSILPVLVENRTGYKNLCELLTQAHLRSEKGKCEIKWEELPQFAEGLVALFNRTVLQTEAETAASTTNRAIGVNSAALRHFNTGPHSECTSRERNRPRRSATRRIRSGEQSNADAI